MSESDKRINICRGVINHIAAMIIQTKWRIHRRQKRKPKNPFRFLESALKIQFAWRSFCNRRVYRYFREIILFKLKGNPQDLLRSLAPGEADFADHAAGIHVRFRLGGVVFPPKIYFKVFTHRPLCDVNSFAPRDYTKERSVILSSNFFQYSYNILTLFFMQMETILILDPLSRFKYIINRRRLSPQSARKLLASVLEPSILEPMYLPALAICRLGIIGTKIIRGGLLSANYLRSNYYISVKRSIEFSFLK